jgi:uncharacterized protein YoxC
MTVSICDIGEYKGEGNDMMVVNSRSEELERRVRELASDVEGEKMVTRHILDQCRRNGAEIAAVRIELGTLGLRIDHLAGDVTQARAALNRLNIITQDVALLRNEVAVVKQDVAGVKQDVAAILAVLSERPA